MAKTGKTAPWVAYYNEMRELFRYDNDIRVVYDMDKQDIKLYVDNMAKSDALQDLLPVEKSFGGVTLTIHVIPNNPNSSGPKLYAKQTVWEDAFAGNGAVDYVEVSTGMFSAVYVVFKKEVVQYFDDNLSDIHGLCSTLYQDIANRIFDDHPGVFFCTNDGHTGYVFSTPSTFSWSTTSND